MRITCAYCGERDSSEFVYHGAVVQPRPAADQAEAARKYFEYVYQRANPLGPNDEYWYHAYGCHAWLRVTRHTGTHEVLEVRAAVESDR